MANRDDIGTPRPLRLDSIGLNARMQQRFEVVFSNAGVELATFVNSTVAEAVVVDIDNAGARRDWPSYRSDYPDRPAIVLSLQEVPVDSPDQRLPKPIEIGALINAINDIRKHLDRLTEPGAAELPAATDGPASADSATVVIEDGDVDPALFKQTLILDHSPLAKTADARDTTVSGGSPEPAANDSAVVDAAISENTLRVDDCLLGHLMRWAGSLKKRDTPSYLGWHQLWFHYDPYTLRVGSNLSRAELAEVCELPCGNIETESGDVPAALADTLERDSNPFQASWSDPDAMLWDMALWTYGDRLPAGTRITERVFLRYWPNMTRLSSSPNALRIAALWCEQPLSIKSIAEALKVPQQDVVRFYGACHSIGIAGPAKRSVDRIFRTAPVPVTPERPMFGRLVSRLRDLLEDRGAASNGNTSP